ncbi:MAG: SDR family oxidoreductase [Actinomycetota bacterium]
MTRGFVVLGAAGALGTEVVSELLRQDVAVLAFDQDQSGLARQVEVHAASRERLAVASGDAAEPADLNGAFEVAVKSFGRVDGVFNITGIQGDLTDIRDTTIAIFESVMRANVRTAWLGTQIGIRYLLAGSGGSIVNTGSILSHQGEARMAAYCASKHAVLGLTRAAAVEYADRGVRVNMLSPGGMNTTMLRRLAETQTDAGQPDTTTARIPAGCLAEPREVARVGAWLLLDAPDHLTGAIIPVDGARSAS